MNYNGHRLMKSTAHACPNCGFWLEWSENVDAPIPHGLLKCIAIAAVCGGVVWLFFGLGAGVAVVGVVAVSAAKILVPPQPEFYCFSCKSYCFKTEVLNEGPRV